jgi:hypothetical protein
MHIEQLLKERDLERAEVTRAASQADDAEQTLAAYKQEFEQVYRNYPQLGTFLNYISGADISQKLVSSVSVLCLFFSVSKNMLK